MISSAGAGAYSRWREAWRRVTALDQVFADGAEPNAASIEETAKWMAGQEDIPRLAFLHTLLVPGITRQALWSVLVPIERQISKLKITDSQIVENDDDSGAMRTVFPITVVLDSIRSAFNTGSIFRTAECFGVGELVLCGYTATPEHPAVCRAAMGTEKKVPWRSSMDILLEVQNLRRRGVKCVALETVEGAETVDSHRWEFPCAIVLGNERFGIRPDVVALCDAVIRIPVFGAKNSLNVGNAFSIAASSAAMAASRNDGIKQSFESNLT